MNWLKKSDLSRFALAAGLMIASVTGLPAAPQAQEEPQAQDSMVLEEIIVTAQKREQRLQDVGIAITAMTGEQLREFGYTNAQEVTAMAPGVSTLQPNGEANYAIAIRGAANNDFITNQESPVALYVDDVYVSQMSAAGFLLFDMDRVEILRGPQGTLFGRNATGGLVHYVTRRPTQDFNSYGSVSFGRYNTLNFQGAVGVPINDKLSARFSVATKQGQGYVENLVRPQQPLNNSNEYAGRLQLLYEPTDNLDILVNARFSRQDIRTGFFEYVSAVLPNSTPTPGVANSNLNGFLEPDGNRDPYSGSYDFPGHNTNKVRGGTVTMNRDFATATLTSITDFQSVRRDYMEDSDASPVNYFNFFLTTNADQFSQELRLAGETDRLTWVAGFYYLHLAINDSNGAFAPGWLQDLFDATIDELGFNGVLNPYNTKTNTWSTFGQLEYALTDTISLVGGFRWIQERKSHTYRNVLSLFPDTVVSGLDPNTVLVADAVTPFSGRRNDGNWSARTAINFKPNDDLLVYLSWNRGVKSGGFNAPLLPTDVFVTDEFLTFGPEKLDAFEGGIKWTLFGGRGTLNLSGYYYDYKNYQAFSIIGLDTFMLNAKSKNKGFEAEFKVNPVAGLQLNFGAAYTDAKVTDVPGVTVDAVTPIGTVAAVVPGATVRPVQTPRWNLNGMASYDFALPSGGDFRLQGNFQYRSKRFFALLQTPASTGAGYSVFDASGTWTPRDRPWSLRLFIKNLANKKYLVQTFDLSGNIDNGGAFFGLIEDYFGRPRTFGVNFDYAFQE